MTYIIDANNLAGNMGLLEEPDFDKILIEEIRNTFAKKQIKIFLIFDSADPFGDKYDNDLTTIIYAPRKDSLQNGADEKVLEIAKQVDEETIVITDDIELTNKIKALDINKIKTEKNDFLIKKIKKIAEADEENTDFLNDITKEFLKKWK